MTPPKVGVATLLFRDPDVTDLSSAELLLARRISSHENGRYGTPGGKVDPGEHPLDTAHRELWEESRRKAVLATLGYVGNCVYPGEGNHFLCLWHYGFVTSEVEPGFVETDAAGNPKSGVYGWHKVADLEAGSLPLMMSTLDAVSYLGKLAVDLNMTIRELAVADQSGPLEIRRYRREP